MSDKTKISVQLGIDEYNVVRVWADKNGLTLSEYVRRTLLASVPSSEKKHVAEEVREQNQTAADHAFAHLEAEDAGNNGNAANFMAPPSAPKPVPAPFSGRTPQKGVLNENEPHHPLQRVNKVTTIGLPTVPPGPHPCVHLSPTPPGNMQGQCQGTCMSSQQRGRVCYWTPTTAKDCTVFEPKSAMERRRQVR